MAYHTLMEITQQTLINKGRIEQSGKDLNNKKIKDKKDQIVSKMLGPCFSFSITNNLEQHTKVSSSILILPCEQCAITKKERGGGGSQEITTRHHNNTEKS